LLEFPFNAGFNRMIGLATVWFGGANVKTALFSKASVVYFSKYTGVFYSVFHENHFLKRILMLVFWSKNRNYPEPWELCCLQNAHPYRGPGFGRVNVILQF
jgi:hypothetical protein